MMVNQNIFDNYIIKCITKKLSAKMIKKMFSVKNYMIKISNKPILKIF